MTDPRNRQLAELLVDTCVGVQPGWQVLVMGTAAGRPLLEEITGLLAERDAYALLRVGFDGNLASRTWLRAAPLERLSTPAPIEVHAMESCDALIVVEAPENTRDAASVDADRTSAMQGAYRPAMERVFRHEVPWVGCQYPTPALAQVCPYENLLPRQSMCNVRLGALPVTEVKMPQPLGHVIP